MRKIPTLLISLLAVFEVLLTVAWMKADIPQQFTSIFLGFYGAVPAWSALAFSIGWFWMILPVASLIWLLLAWRSQVQGRNAWAITGASLVGFVSMMYAMYPLHIMRSMAV